MEVLSPRSTNIPSKAPITMKKTKQDVRPKQEEKPSNPDRIDDRWRPPSTITEPGAEAETYATGKKLGKGGFAVCFEGKTQKHGQIFALKVVKAQVQQKKMMEKFRTEMQIHAKMKHPNIVEFFRAFSLEGHTYVVLEMCENGSLTEMVKARSCLSLPEVRRFMIQICGGVKYLHRRSVIHRDLKMGNIFLDSKLNLKIGDFGLAAVMADEQDRRTTLCGTPNYIAPEILSKSGTRGHDFKVDTWAIGVICYAMLMGTPPFQSKTQQEIYTKLKTLEYEWKVDSINYISQEAKDCVASCLNLTAADRPDMDELVEHEFFKSGSIADELDLDCLKTTPAWLLNADPRGDRVRHGYGISHAKICAECGVGKMADGRPHHPVGAKSKISALVEIEVENRKGTAPVTPLPEGILYKQICEAQIETVSQLATKPRSRKPVDESFSSSTTNNTTIQPSQTTLPQRLASSVRPIQSFAAQQRQQALPRSTIPRTVNMAKEPSIQVTELTEEKTTETQGYFRTRPVRAASARNVRAAQTRDTDPPKQTLVSVQKEENSGRSSQERDRVAQYTSNRDTSRTTSRVLRPQPSSNARPLSMSSFPSSDLGSDLVQTRAQVPEDSRKARPRSALLSPSKEKTHQMQQSDTLKSNPIFRPRLISNSDQSVSLACLTHRNISNSLRDLYLSLGSTSDRPNRSTRTETSRNPHPRVDKWVDYATKHGIAYILSEGSLGMILKSSRAEATASSCIVVRNARRHTVKRARGLEHQFVPQGRDASDVEFYEQVDSEVEMKRLDIPSKEFELDLERHSSQVSAATAVLNNLSGSAAQRMKEVGLLDKFGKYMNKQMGSSDYSSSDSRDSINKGHFIHFYQRMGNVGCWRFADGGMQFNFPDHTKLIIYQPETMAREDDAFIDLVYLEPSDAKELAAHGVLTNESLERRGLRTFRLSDLRRDLHHHDALRRSEAEIIRTNEIREKLAWIRGVLGCWLREGGLGRSGDEKLGWSGLQERRDDKRVKLQWVTVGRPGGDEDST